MAVDVKTFDLMNVVDRLLRSQVYFLREERDGPIKIGFAADVVKRLHGLQQGNPSALRVVATMIGGIKEERFCAILGEIVAWCV